MKSASVKDCTLFYHEVKHTEKPSVELPCFVWAHGWGQNHQAFLKLVQPFENRFHHIMIDFPGFGQSPEPSVPWGTEDYADMAAEFLQQKNITKVIWVGHSFGCRVGLHMAAKYPDLIAAQCYIAGAGLKLPKPFFKSLYFKGRIALYKSLKKLIPLGLSQDWLMSRFGSRDYKNSSGMVRQIFVKVVNEDLVEQAQSASCPTLLIYGSDDSETPPALGRKLDQLIPDSEYHELEGQDHYTVLDSGRHQVIKRLNHFIQRLGFATK